MRLEKVRINTVTYFNPENSFAVIKLVHDGKLITATGQVPELLNFSNIRKAEGIVCDVEGKWVKHPQYGIQIELHKLQIDSTGMIFFLTNFVSGIGEKLSKKLVEHYGEEQLREIIENDPFKLIEFKGIGEKKAERIARSYRKYKTMLDISKLFSAYNVKITPNQLLKIYNYFLFKEKEKGKDQVNISDIEKTLKEDIFELTEIDGIGFKTVDRIARDLKYKKTDLKRVGSLVVHAINKIAQEEGHTYLTLQQLIDKMVEYADDDVPENEIPVLKQKYLEVLISNKDKLRETRRLDIIEDKIITTTYFRHAEAWINNWIEKRKRVNSPIRVSKDEALQYIEEKERELGIKLSEEQKKAVLSVATEGHSLFILCGYAGTGKSTISKIILDFYAKYIRKEEIITTAFTGMASKRIKDASGYNGKTIHSLLEFDGKIKKFKRNHENRLPYKVVLIDEASMVSLSLMYHLLRAIRDDAVVIMVGDDAQLPAIGEGNVFADLLARDDIPKVKLTKIFRQSEDSVITYFADFVRKGQVPPIKAYHHYKDMYAVVKNPKIRKDMDDKLKEEIRDKFYTNIRNTMIEDIKRLKSSMEYTQAIMDIQVIAPQKKGILGTDALNEILQDILNPDSKAVQIRGFKLKLYDKIIHLKNENMEAIVDEDIDYKNLERVNKTEMRIFNGSVGMVVHIDEDEELFVVDYDFCKVIYSFDHYKDIVDLAYALTVHKTQGSQFRYVFLPIFNNSYVMLNSKLFYTAMTRAKEKLFLYTQPFALKRASTNVDNSKRQTFLSNLELLKSN
ncbi:MAG: ATP-dependent RecD-like DNA helicase [Sulfurihydrogenibium sp.]|jgi:exodeoxyribonuclease V alpha subunit|nr:ATP-dependent RecD-like DNA helicase [Sulfurihydrogenibium sp.]